MPGFWEHERKKHYLQLLKRVSPFLLSLRRIQAIQTPFLVREMGEKLRKGIEDRTTSNTTGGEG